MGPRLNHTNASSSKFDAARFWIHGGSLFFGEEMSGKVASGHDPILCLPCGCEVEIDMTDDNEI